MPFSDFRSFVSGALWCGLVACSRGQDREAIPQPNPSATVTECRVSRTVRLGIAGGYGINGNGIRNETTPFPIVYLDPVFEPGMQSVLHVTTARLPLLPALSRRVEEFCSSEVIDGVETVRCLNDEGKPKRVTFALEETAKRLGVPPHCIVIKNEIAVRNLDDLAREWQSVLGRCLGVHAKQKIEVALTLERSKDEPGAASAIARLSIPAIGFNRQLGHIRSFPLCDASRLRNPAGIRVTCSDDGLSYAEVYTYGNTLLYRIEETEAERNGGIGPSMQSVELPCNLEPEFRFHSYARINHTLAK